MPTGLRDLLSLIVPFGDALPERSRTLPAGRWPADGTGTLPGGGMPMLSGTGTTRSPSPSPAPDRSPTACPTARAGTYGQGIVGPGLAARVDGIDATAGQTDLIGSDVGQGTVWLDPAGPAGDLAVELARTNRARRADSGWWTWTSVVSTTTGRR